MGNFIQKVIILVKWIGDIIYKVIKWFEGLIRELVEEIVKAFLLKNKKNIESADDPYLTGKVLGQLKAIQELKKIAKKEKKDLSVHDQEIIENLFNNDEYSI